MAKKKKKSVLEYDPLAWLNDSGEKEITDKADDIKNDKVVASNESGNKPEDDGFGFFADDNDHGESVENTESENGFGFFTDTTGALKADDVKDETADDGFGFFADDPAALKTDDMSEESTENEGFGFFTDDEGQETVNTETLNITKDEAVNLGSELTIKTVSVLKEQIVDLLAADEDIVINAEEMIKIDTAGLQLLYSLKETLNKTGHHIKWIGTSTVINDSADMIGMPLLAPKSKEACFGFFEENIISKDAEDGNSGFF